MKRRKLSHPKDDPPLPKTREEVVSLLLEAKRLYRVEPIGILTPEEENAVDLFMEEALPIMRANREYAEAFWPDNIPWTPATTPSIFD